MKSEYLPYPAIIDSIEQESFDTRTFRVVFTDEKIREGFEYRQGQFAQVSCIGAGEAPISISSSPHEREILEFTIRKMGRLTAALHKLKVGDALYIRGPYGNSFPFEEVKGKNLLFIAGGIGLPPLRSVIRLVFHHRGDFGKVKILYGARTPGELCFKKEIKRWGKLPDAQVLLTVDKPDKDWKGNVGVVTTLWDKTEISGKEAVAYVCGPPVMIKFVVKTLLDSGFEEDKIFITLERYMKCGIGKCGHCNIGGKFVCIDGPVFAYSQIKKFPEKENAI